MIEKIQHIGYLVADLDTAAGWFERSFGARNAGGGPLGRSSAVPTGGRNAYIRFGGVEVELIEPADRGGLPQDVLVMHHVGYVVADISKTAAQLKERGFKFTAEAPFTNVMGQQVLYFDAATTNGVLVHLTQLPEQPSTAGAGPGLAVEKIVHAGYLVEDLDAAIAWYVGKFDGVHVGGGRTAAGGRNAFVNFGQVQVELIEPGDQSAITGKVCAMDHVGHVAADIGAAIADCKARGFRFVADSPNTNSIGQRVLYFDPATSMGSRMHLTQLPD